MPTANLDEILLRALRDANPSALCVAFSGGPDSTALLHALAQPTEARARGLRALHVDHGLHAESVAWAEHCAGVCQTLGVPLTTVRVQVDDSRGEGMEAAARRARYAAFAEHLQDCEWLALAHHRDDQVETILLKLLRGAGPEGLGGMRTLRPFARGFLWRPLLETTRETFRKYLVKNEFTCVEDPANADPRFARNVLRREILPNISSHWPHAHTSILHAARLCRVAADYIESAAHTALADLQRDRGSLDAGGWLALPDALRAPVLDAWLHARGFTAPPDAARAELQHQATAAANDGQPRIAWAGTEVRIWNGRLYAMPRLAAPPDDWSACWDGAALSLPGDGGTLVLERVQPDGNAVPVRFAAPLAVRLRRGGERIKPAGAAHTRELRDLFQQARLPPWLRERCPLVYDDAVLIAVADLWISERGERVFDRHGARPRWQRPAWS